MEGQSGGKNSPGIVRVPVNWIMLGFAVFCAAASALMLASGYTSLKSKPGPLGALMLSIFAIFYCWKSVEISAKGICFIRFGLFRRIIRWKQIFQVVETPLGDKGERKALLFILCSIPTTEKFKKEQDVHTFVSANSSHVYLLEYPYGRSQEVRDAVEQYWGEIEEPV